VTVIQALVLVLFATRLAGRGPVVAPFVIPAKAGTQWKLEHEPTGRIGISYRLFPQVF